MPRNYMREMEELLVSLPFGERPRLLLHVCCAPCACGSLPVLSPRFDVTMLFYNPNIRPAEEYEKRLEYVRRLPRLLPSAEGAGLVESPRREADFLAAAGFENAPEGGERCARCVRLRLEETAKLAREGGYGFFCTTLTTGPRKNAELINAIGQELGAEYGVRWLPSDFKKRDGYLRSIRLSGQYDIYRQRYCGCTPGEGA